MASDNGVNVTTVRPRRGRPLGQLQPEGVQRRYRGQRKFSVREIKEALLRNFGNAYAAANALNEGERARGGTRTIDRRAVAYHVKRRPELMALADEGRDEICDVAEQAVFKAIRTGDTSLAMRYLETQGKNRGYSRRAEVAAAVMTLDPATLTIEQAVAFFDPTRLTDEQLNAVLEHLESRFGDVGGPVIDNDRIRSRVMRSPFRPP